MLFCTTAAALALTASPPPNVAAAKTSLRQLFNSPGDATLACPTSKLPLKREVVVLGSQRRTRQVSPEGVAYPVTELYNDLLPTAASSSTLSVDELLAEVQDAWSNRVQTQLFRSPFTSFLYERGWRQQFANAGFPGIDVEFAEVSEFFAPVATDGVVVDMSCGSGLMTRRLLKSGSYKRVLALDYSESMLTETARRVREEKVPNSETLTLCRADVASLPLQPGSVDAMHAGAAMHCWPQLEEGLQQIRMALKPGGRFFATTFLQGAYGAAMPRQTGGSGFRFFDDEAELTELLVGAGFPRAGVSVRREGRGCAIIRAELLVEEEEVTAAEEEVTAAAEEEALAEEVTAVAEEAADEEAPAEEAADEEAADSESSLESMVDKLDL